MVPAHPARLRLTFCVTPPPAYIGTSSPSSSIGDEFNLQNANQQASIKNRCKENLVNWWLTRLNNNIIFITINNEHMVISYKMPILVNQSRTDFKLLQVNRSINFPGISNVWLLALSVPRVLLWGIMETVVCISSPVLIL